MSAWTEYFMVHLITLYNLLISVWWQLLGSIPDRESETLLQHLEEAWKQETTKDNTTAKGELGARAWTKKNIKNYNMGKSALF